VYTGAARDIANRDQRIRGVMVRMEIRFSPSLVITRPVVACLSQPHVPAKCRPDYHYLYYAVTVVVQSLEVITSFDLDNVVTTRETTEGTLDSFRVLGYSMRIAVTLLLRFKFHHGPLHGPHNTNSRCFD